MAVYSNYLHGNHAVPSWSGCLQHLSAYARFLYLCIIDSSIFAILDDGTLMLTEQV